MERKSLTLVLCNKLCQLLCGRGLVLRWRVVQISQTLEVVMPEVEGFFSLVSHHVCIALLAYFFLTTVLPSLGMLETLVCFRASLLFRE